MSDHVRPSASKRGRGRPAIPPELKKRHSLTFRVRDEQRATLQRYADAAGRSLSEEVEHRLELSFHRPEPFREAIAAFARFVEAERAVVEPDDGLAEIAEAVIVAAVEDRIRGGGGRL